MLALHSVISIFQSSHNDFCFFNAQDSVFQSIAEVFLEEVMGKMRAYTFPALLLTHAD